MKANLRLFALLAFGASLGLAGTICPAGNGSTPFPHASTDPTGCAAILTVAANGTVSAALTTDPAAYESSEDILIGVTNNSSSSITTMTLTGSGIFGFDNDGICNYTFVGNSYCLTNGPGGTSSVGTLGAGNGIDPYDYQGPTSRFSNYTSNTGTVTFSPALAPGQSTYFSLEGVPSANVTGTVTGSTGVPISAPALAAIMVGLLGIGLYLLRTERLGATL